MGKSKVTVKFDFKDLLDGVMDEFTAKDLNDYITDQATDAMSKGLSPVKGFGRYDGYKKPNKYPGKRKQKRPVNLKLSGNLYNSFGYTLKNKVFEWGISKDSAVENVLDYAAVHNDGTNKNIVQRQYVPNNDGDEFTVTIMNGIKKILALKLWAIIKLSNK